MHYYYETSKKLFELSTCGNIILIGLNEVFFQVVLTNDKCLANLGNQITKERKKYNKFCLLNPIRPE